MKFIQGMISVLLIFAIVAAVWLGFFWYAKYEDRILARSSNKIFPGGNGKITKAAKYEGPLLLSMFWFLMIFLFIFLAILILIGYLKAVIKEKWHEIVSFRRWHERQAAPV